MTQKNGRKEAQEAQKSDRVGKGVFPNLQPGRTEIDKQSVFHACGAQVSEKLRDMFVYEGTARLQLHDETAVHEQVREEFAQQRAILVKDVKGVLLKRHEALFSQPLGKTVFIHLLRMAMPEVFVQ